MMKKIFFVALATATLVACKSESKSAKKEVESAKTSQAVSMEDGVKIAYYVLDSVAEKFDVYKRELDVFEKEGTSLQNQLAGMQKEYERVYMEYENGARKQVLTPNQMAGYEQRLQGLQQKMAEFQNSKMVAFQKKQMDATTAIQNKITQYSEEFATLNNIDLFFVSGTGSQLAYANPSLDMTERFIAYMNEKEEAVGK